MPNVGHENQPFYENFATLRVNVDSTAPATLQSHGVPGGPCLVYLKANPDNTDDIAIGGSDITATTGWILIPGEMSPPIIADSRSVYVIAAVDNEDLEIIVQY